MRKRMEPIEVAVGEGGTVLIRQENWGNDDSVVAISPDQVDTLIQWLQEAKQEAQQMEPATT